MNALKRMKLAARKAREAAGEPPPPKPRCCNSMIEGRHTRTCPNHPSKHCRPEGK